MTNPENSTAPSESDAARAAYEALERLDPTARARVLRWLFDALGVGTRVRVHFP